MLDINSPHFGAEIKEQLYQLDITQTELAEKLGITVAYLSDILRNKRFSRRRKEQITETLASMKAEVTRQ